MRNHPHMRKINDWQLVVFTSFTMLVLLHSVHKINIDFVDKHSIIFGDIAVGVIALLLIKRYCKTQFFYLRRPSSLKGFLIASFFVLILYFLNGGNQNFDAPSTSKELYGIDNRDAPTIEFDYLR